MNFFDGLSDQQIAELQGMMTRRTFARGEVVFHQGDPGAALHIVESGWFLVQALTADGDRVGMTIEGPGHVFGELSMLDDEGRRTATVRALRKATTLSLDGAHFHRLRLESPWIDRFLVSLLARRVERLSIQLAEAAWLSAEQRLCRQLERLVDVFSPEPIFLKQAELASLTQTTRPTVSSVLGELAKQGIVRTGRGSVAVLDRSALRARLAG